jgi:hypothetical protein
MRTIGGAVLRLGRTGRGLLPAGQLLTPEVWARRHRGIVWLLWLHVAGIAVFALARGMSVAHALQEASLVAVFALPAATRPSAGGPGRRRPCSGAGPERRVQPPCRPAGPWEWALIHGGFVLGASVAYLVNWRLSEHQAIEISRLVSRLEGLAAPTRSPACPTGGCGRRSCPESWSGPGGRAPGLAWP